MTRLLMCLGLVSASAFANTITQYSDPTLWQSASTSLSVITFAGLGGTDSSPDQLYSSGLTTDGVTFVGAFDYLYVRNASPSFLFGPPDGDLGCPPVSEDPSCGPSGGMITVTLPAGIESLAWDFGNFYDPGGVTVDFLDGEILTASGLSGFVGFTALDPIAGFRIESAGYPTVANFEFGLTTAGAGVPEPNTILLIGSGMALLYLGLRRRIRA